MSRWRRLLLFVTAASLALLIQGVDSIALDRAGEWLYYAAVTAEHMWRLRASDLAQTMPPAELSRRVERPRVGSTSPAARCTG